MPQPSTATAMALVDLHANDDSVVELSLVDHRALEAILRELLATGMHSHKLMQTSAYTHAHTHNHAHEYKSRDQSALAVANTHAHAHVHAQAHAHAHAHPLASTRTLTRSRHTIARPLTSTRKGQKNLKLAEETNAGMYLLLCHHHSRRIARSHRESL